MDDLAGSDLSIHNIKVLVQAADKWFSEVGLACKGWTFSFEDPPEEVAEEGHVVSVGGLKWYSKLDLIEVALPDLHFSKKVRGRLQEGTDVFRGSTLSELDQFVPKSLTRRQVFSKNGTIFDPLGKLIPITAGLSLDLRDSVKATIQWDDCIGEELRNKWVKNFLKIEKLKGIKFQRAKLPHNAVNHEMEVIIGADTSESLMVVGAWGRFLLDDDSYSCQQIIGRSLLADMNSTIAKNELTVFMMGSNLGWLVKMALDSWISKLILIGDSTIALCWVSSENKKLSLFHRNRCVQIRRGTNLDQMFHVTTEHNPADLPTRPSLVQEKDVGPMSSWEKGLPWMRQSVDEAISMGILTPVSELRMSEQETEDFNKGFIYEKTKDILTKGHITVLATSRVENVLLRAQHSKYLIPLNKFKFEKTVRVLSVCYKFLNVVTKGKFFQKTRPELKFKAFATSVPAVKNSFSGLSFGCENPNLRFVGKFHLQPTEEEISRSLHYLFSKATSEMKHFHKKDFLEKICFEKDGILLCKSRLLEGHRLVEAGGLENLDIVQDLNLNFCTPVVDRYSPLAYSIGEYVHRVLSNHSGYENSYRHSLHHCYIVQGLGLFREIGEDCVRCIKKRKRYLDLPMGPISNEQLIMSPPMWIAMCDVYGPIEIYVPGFSMKTRSRKEIQTKVYVLVFCCPVSKVVNMQVIEGKSTEAFAEGFTRLACEIGYPSFVLADQDSALVKLLNEAEVNLLDLQYYLHKEVKGIKFRVCPVAAHNFHGLVERRIRTIQECFDECDLKTKRLHATGVQTFCKIVENNINNLPLGYSYGRDDSNSPLLKLICPNMLRIGRLNTRSIQGPVKLPKGPSELMQKVEERYRVFYKLWNVSYIPKLVKASKWYKLGDQLEKQDIVFFKKTEGALSSDWTVGKVIDIVKGKDDVVRTVEIEYRNSAEDFSRSTTRGARSVVKLFNIEDTDTWNRDMDEVGRLVLSLLAESNVMEESVNVKKKEKTKLTRKSGVHNTSLAAEARDKIVEKLNCSRKMKCSKCCCRSHCCLTSHNKSDVTLYGTKLLVVNSSQLVSSMLDGSWQSLDECVADLEEVIVATRPDLSELSSCLTAMQMDFSA